MSRKKPPVFQSNGRCVCYLRVSTGSQAKSGLGLQAQADICAKQADKLGLHFRRDGNYDSVSPARQGHFVDAGETAFGRRFAKRAAGARLLEFVLPGDAVIVSKVDRLCRNMVDFIETANVLEARGVRLIVCNPQFDFGTAVGRMQARMLANLAEWESDRKSERIIAALKAKKARDGDTKPTSEKETSLPSEWRPMVTEPSVDSIVHKPGRIFLYVRCSHRESAESGLGMLVQTDVTRDHAMFMTEQNPLLEIKDVFTDAAVSAHKHDLRNRIAGKNLDAELRDGDHVVFATLDRGFRNVLDMANTLKAWSDRGVQIHFVGEGMSTNDPGCQMMLQVIAVFAQMEADLGSARSAEARAQLAAKGRFVGGREPPFWKVYHAHGTKQLVIDRKRIVAFRLIQMLRRSGMTITAALERSEQLHAKREKRPAIPLSGVAKMTVLSGQLPRDYERDRNGRAFPLFTVDRYQTAKPQYDQALADYRKVAAKRRESRKVDV